MELKNQNKYNINMLNFFNNFSSSLMRRNLQSIFIQQTSVFVSNLSHHTWLCKKSIYGTNKASFCTPNGIITTRMRCNPVRLLAIDCLTAQQVVTPPNNLHSFTFYHSSVKRFTKSFLLCTLAKTKKRCYTTLNTQHIGVEKILSTHELRLQKLCTLEPVGPYNLIRNLNSGQKQCLQKFINLCMRHGKKNKSFKLISNTLYQLAISKGPLGLIFLINAIENVKPIIEVKKVRISGTTQLVPSILSKNRQRSLAIRWIIEAAIQRRNIKKNMTLDQCLLAELIDAAQNIGTVRKKRDDLHKLAESNRGFAHYRWW